MAPTNKPNEKVAILDRGLDALEPHRERVSQIKKWHVEQATSDRKPVASLNITITFDGEIETTGLGLEPIYVQLLLDEMNRVSGELELQLHPNSLDVPRCGW